MLQIGLDIATMILLLGAGVGALVFHRRISRLRDAIAEAGEILPKLDAAVARMNETANGFSTRIQSEMQAVEGRVAAARNLAGDLSASSRTAEDMIARLDQQLRQVKRQEQARARAVPRELAEPKGFAEEMERRRGYADPDPAQLLAEQGHAATLAAHHVETRPAQIGRSETVRAERIEPTLEPAPRVSRFAVRREPDAEEPKRERIGIMSASTFNSFSSVEV